MKKETFAEPKESDLVQAVRDLEQLHLTEKELTNQTEEIQKELDAATKVHEAAKDKAARLFESIKRERRIIAARVANLQELAGKTTVVRRICNGY